MTEEEKIEKKVNDLTQFTLKQIAKYCTKSPEPITKKMILYSAVMTTAFIISGCEFSGKKNEELISIIPDMLRDYIKEIKDASEESDTTKS